MSTVGQAEVPPTEAGGAPTGQRRVLATVRAYVALTKPRIIELLLVTTLPTMVLAAGGLPGWVLTIATLVGGTLAAGSANVFNCVIDRDIDKVMNRTRKRPLATGEVSVPGAMVFGTVLGIGSVAVFLMWVNVLSAVLAVAAILMYVVGYTLILKRRTPQNIVWGGAAGCMPVFIAWAAVTGTVGWAAVALFGIVFFWTPPHYWPLSMRFRKDYAAARVPMLPVVADNVRVAREMVAYSVAMVACSIAVWPLAGTTWVYPVVAGALGVWFTGLCVMLARRARHPERRLAEMGVFHASITYLTLLFVAIAVDPFLPL